MTPFHFLLTFLRIPHNAFNIISPFSTIPQVHVHHIPSQLRSLYCTLFSTYFYPQSTSDIPRVRPICDMVNGHTNPDILIPIYSNPILIQYSLSRIHIKPLQISGLEFKSIIGVNQYQTNKVA